MLHISIKTRGFDVDSCQCGSDASGQAVRFKIQSEQQQAKGFKYSKFLTNIFVLNLKR